MITMYKTAKTLQSFCQCSTWAGDIPTHEPFTLCAVHRSSIEPQSGFGNQFPFEFIRGYAEFAAVHPDEIGSLQDRDRKSRQMFTTEPPHIEIIGMQILDELVQPLFPFIVSCLGSYYTERIDIVYLVIVDSTIDFRPALGIGADNVRNLQPGDIERLTGGYAGNGMP